MLGLHGLGLKLNLVNDSRVLKVEKLTPTTDHDSNLTPTGAQGDRILDVCGSVHSKVKLSRESSYMQLGGSKR